MIDEVPSPSAPPPPSTPSLNLFLILSPIAAVSLDGRWSLLPLTLSGVPPSPHCRLSGHRILLVEKAVATRATLSHYVDYLQAHIAKQRVVAAAAVAADSAPKPWVEPVLGVFVVHSREQAKEVAAAAAAVVADKEEAATAAAAVVDAGKAAAAAAVVGEGLQGLVADPERYFVCEAVGQGVHIAYPFHVEGGLPDRAPQ